MAAESTAAPTTSTTDANVTAVADLTVADLTANVTAVADLTVADLTVADLTAKLTTAVVSLPATEIAALCADLTASATAAVPRVAKRAAGDPTRAKLIAVVPTANVFVVAAAAGPTASGG